MSKQSKIATESTEIISEETQQERVYRTQNRRVTVMMVPEWMPDGTTMRVKQILDRPIKFGVHREFLAGLNTIREKVYGPGVFYDTKNAEIPLDDNLVVQCVTLNSATGALISHKVFTATEARDYLARIREELENRFQARKNGSSGEEFGTSLQDAMQNAAGEAKAAAN